MVLCFFICVSCTEPEKDYTVFTEKKPQEAAERTVRELTPVDSLNLTEVFDAWSRLDLKHSNNGLFVKLDYQIVRLNKEDLSTENILNIPEGRGPGELLSIRDFDVGNGFLVMLDGEAQKTVIYDLNGNLIEEFLNDKYLVDMIEIAGRDTFYYQIATRHDYLFYKGNRENEIHLQFASQTEGINILAYTGEMIYHNHSLYFGGYSEPLFRRYDLSGEEPELVFSRAVIDDYNSENNYREAPTSDGMRLQGYSDEVQYASMDIDADKNYLYSVRHANGTVDYKYLDLYSVEDGSYRVSFPLHYYPVYITVDEDYVYTIELEGSDPIQRHLIKYEKPDMNF